MRGQDNILYPDMISGPKVTWRDKILSVWNRIPFWIPFSLSIIIICTVFVARNVKQINEASGVSMLTRTILPEEEHLLEGMYYVKSLDGDNGIYSSAEIRGSEGIFGLTIYSDYSPMNLEAILLSDGTLSCDGLGEGTISYKPSVGSISITFNKGGKDICEFSK